MVMTQMRRPWTFEEVARLLSMAEKYPSAQIASEIGRPNSFRPHEGSQTGHLFANGSAPATDNRSGASGLGLPGRLSERGHRYQRPVPDRPMI
jgi:hypothetical protein